MLASAGAGVDECAEAVGDGGSGDGMALWVADDGGAADGPGTTVLEPLEEVEFD